MKLAIAIPLVHGMAAEVVEPLLNGVLEATRFGEVEVHTSIDLLPYDNARQTLFDECIEAGCDRLWAIDSDCFLAPGTFKKLFDVMEERKAQAVLAHNYIRGYPYLASWFAPHEGKFYRVDATSGVHQISSGALHCSLIDLAWVSKHMTKPYFRYVPSEDETKRVSEDAYFYSEMGKAGGLVLGNADARVGHVYTRIVISDKTAGYLRAAQAAMMEVLK